MHRRLLLPEAVILALLGLLGWLLVSNLHQPRPRLAVPTKANFDWVKEGMTRKEVETILGPPGLHTERMTITNGDFLNPGQLRWIEDNAIITVEFILSDEPREEWQEEWRVVSKKYDRRPPEPFLERLGRWREHLFGPI